MKEGIYRGVLTLNAETGTELPFNFELKYIKRKPQLVIHNADERITVDEITQKGDSVFIRMPVFDTEFRCRQVGENLEGVWINHYRSTQNVIPFKAAFGAKERFGNASGISAPVFDGKWEVTFSPGKADSSKAIGVFKQVEQTDLVNGTFLTETGDYRYLEGLKQDNKLFLSAFDGSHAFLFIMELRDKRLEGTFYSGNHWQEKFSGFKNENFTLRDAEAITFVKNPELPLQFSLQDLDGNMVSLSDKKFENKPVVVQLMGSWCPNCLDESTFLSEIYKLYHPQGLELIALAFEKTTDPVKARAQVSRLRDKLDLRYPILLSLQTGKEKAGALLPALNKITAFPTTLFLNRQHQIVKVHTGFSGPATGNDFVIFKERTYRLIQTLLKE